MKDVYRISNLRKVRKRYGTLTAVIFILLLRWYKVLQKAS